MKVNKKYQNQRSQHHRSGHSLLRRPLYRNRSQPYIKKPMSKADEIKFWKRAIRILKKGYGADCRTTDLDDFKKMYRKYTYREAVESGGRCGSCLARETIKFIESRIELLNQ